MFKLPVPLQWHKVAPRGRQSTISFSGRTFYTAILYKTQWRFYSKSLSIFALQYKCDHWTWKILIKQCLFEKEFFDFHWYSHNATSCYRLSSDYCEKMPLVQHFMTALSSSTFFKNSSAFQYLCVVVTYFTVTHINKKILNRASLISQHHILMMTVHISSHHAFPGLYIQCIKVCMTAHSCCPQASGTSQQQSHHSHSCRTASVYRLLCRTVQGEVWPCCACRQTPWSVTHRFSLFHITAPRYDKMYLLHCVHLLSSPWLPVWKRHPWWCWEEDTVFPLLGAPQSPAEQEPVSKQRKSRY